MFATFMEMSSRRSLTESLTELYDNVRSKNPSNVSKNLLEKSPVSRILTNLELKKPGMASTNFSSVSSSPRAQFIVQSKIWKSISDDFSRALSSALFFKPSNAKPRSRNHKSWTHLPVSSSNLLRTRPRFLDVLKTQSRGIFSIFNSIPGVCPRLEPELKDSVSLNRIWPLCSNKDWSDRSFNFDKVWVHHSEENIRGVGGRGGESVSGGGWVNDKCEDKRNGVGIGSRCGGGWDAGEGASVGCWGARGGRAVAVLPLQKQ